jgi:hypothetical protein
MISNTSFRDLLVKYITNRHPGPNRLSPGYDANVPQNRWQGTTAAQLAEDFG